jgi:predicted nucleic acid-binding protein
LDLLRELYDEVLIPEAVRDEVLRAGHETLGIDVIRAAFSRHQFTVSTVADRSAVAGLEARLHRGEAEAIVLVREAQADLLLLDDGQARDYASGEGIPITGTVGILQQAREEGLIQSVSPTLGELQRLGFRISQALVEAIRRDEEKSETDGC